MVDRMPRIFRTLETRGGQAAFDTIVEAAVAGFLASHRPSPTHVAEFSRLMASIWAKLSVDTKRQLAIALATSSNVPRPVVELLLSEPAEVSAPFLFSSPCLTKDDARAIGSPLDATPSEKVGLRAADAAPPAEEPRREAGPRSSRSEVPPPLESAAAARDALRALVRAKPRQSLQRPLSSPPPPPLSTETAAGAADVLSSEATAGALLREARAGRPARVLALIAAPLKLPAETVQGFATDADGVALAAALKLLGLTVADAMTVLLMVHQTAGQDVAAFAELRRLYERLSMERSAAVLGVKDLSALAASRTPPQAEHQPLHAPEGRRRSVAPGQQTVFGRRRNKPSGPERKGWLWM
mgnify:CR=1 FL=1